MAKVGVTVPKGFKAAGVACGLKKNGNPDLAMIVSEIIAQAAGIFTTNLVKGHSLKWSRDKIRNGLARAVVINSGCANACVGPRGDSDAAEMALYSAGLIGCSAEQVMLGSTGVIGFPLEMDKIKTGIHDAWSKLSADGGELAARAIMTTDTFPKTAAASFELEGSVISIGGMAKGSGMLHPNMATMISVLTTDAAISAELLDKALKIVADSSFNRVSVDGDTSVCDQVIILANGQAGNPPITSEGSAYKAFLSSLLEVCETLSKMLARDGEGATKLIEICVKRCRDRNSAHMILNAVARSPLVKTALFGQDANWGRIFTAAGYSGAQFDPDKTDIYLGDLLVCRNGTGLAFDEESALNILKNEEVTITLDFKDGEIDDRIWTCDFSYDYIRINGSYRS